MSRTESSPEMQSSNHAPKETNGQGEGREGMGREEKGMAGNGRTDGRKEGRKEGRTDR